MPAEKSLKDRAKDNPTQLGDPVSLKAETSNTKPTDQDLGAKSDKSSSTKGDAKTLKQKAEANPSMLGDPVSLKAETSNTEPTDQDRGALGTSKREKGSGKPKM